MREAAKAFKKQRSLMKANWKNTIYQIGLLEILLYYSFQKRDKKNDTRIIRIFTDIFPETYSVGTPFKNSFLQLLQAGVCCKLHNLSCRPVCGCTVVSSKYGLDDLRRTDFTLNCILIFFFCKNNLYLLGN